MLRSITHLRRMAALAAAVAVVCAMACSKGGGQPVLSNPKPVWVELDGTDVKLIEFRLGTAELELTQNESGLIRIEGDLRVGAVDANSANLHAGKVDLEVVHSHVTIVTLPAPPEGYTHAARLKVTVPRGVNLRAVLGEGTVQGKLDLPLVTDIELGAGAVDLTLPRHTSAFVAAGVNIAAPVDFAVRDFNRITGERERTLTRVSFNGQIGTPLQLVGSRLEVRVNAGSCKIHGDPPRAQEATGNAPDHAPDALSPPP